MGLFITRLIRVINNGDAVKGKGTYLFKNSTFVFSYDDMAVM